MASGRAFDVKFQQCCRKVQPYTWACLEFSNWAGFVRSVFFIYSSAEALANQRELIGLFHDYRVTHKKRPQHWNDVVWLNSRILTKRNDSFKEQSIRTKAQFITFSANHCDWISISCSNTCWTYWLFCTFQTPNTLLRISLLKQKRIKS